MPRRNDRAPGHRLVQRRCGRTRQSERTVGANAGRNREELARTRGGAECRGGAVVSQVDCEFEMNSLQMKYQTDKIPRTK